MGGQIGWWTEEQFDTRTKWCFGVFMPITSNKMYLTCHAAIYDLAALRITGCKL